MEQREEKGQDIMEKKREDRESLAYLVLRPLAAGMGAICVLLTLLAAAAAYPVAREAGRVWLLWAAVPVVLACCAGGMVFLLRYVSRKYLTPLSLAVEEVSLAASGDLTGPADPIPCASKEVEILLEAVGALGDQSTACLVKMEDTLKRMASGDFTAKVDCVRSPECGGVCALLDGAVDRLRGAIGNVRTALEQLAGPLDVLEGDAAALEESAGEQRQARDKLLWALERLGRGADGGGADSAADDLRVRLDWYGRRQKELLGAIERINAYARTSGQIVKAMESTAFQCSVLARTAYVEAAGAGVDGKGFAVVASELRKLASRSAQSSQDAAAFMEEMNRTVRESVLLASASAREAEELAQASVEVHRKAEEAARGAARTEEIQAAAHQASAINTLAEQEHTKAANAAQTARLVKQRAGRLREALQGFKIN